MLSCRWHYRRRKCRVQSVFHQETPEPAQTSGALPELHDAPLRGPGGASGPGEGQSEGGGEGDGDGQQRPRQPQECEQRPLWSGGPIHSRLAVRTRSTARDDALIADCLTTAHGMEGKGCDDDVSVST